mmetsp:Transcript_945/g.2177  ORF Transcript_945/g.2177 Transcript_945/m.2177 type:complete len:93 (+) Transcript_945:223-501(+)
MTGTPRALQDMILIQGVGGVGMLPAPSRGGQHPATIGTKRLNDAAPREMMLDISRRLFRRQAPVQRTLPNHRRARLQKDRAPLELVLRAEQV